MRLFDDIKAMKDIQKIKSGGKAKLSISQITGLITNMMDARKNLSPKEFDDIYNLFSNLRKCNTKIEMDIEGFNKVCIDIIKKFDAIAPYQKFSGGNELEISFLMDDIKKEDEELKVCIDENFELTEADMKYVNEMMNSSMGMILEDDAKKFMQVIYAFATFGKEYSLKKFNALATNMIETDKFMAMPRIGFLTGVLKANSIINESEMKDINNKYESIAIELLKK